MSIAVLVFTWRKPGTSMEDFISHYETSHIVKLREIAGNDFPLEHKRVYIDSSVSGTVYRGSAEQAGYNCMAEILFKDEEHLNRFNATIAPKMESILEDEKRFLDVEKTLAVKSVKVNSSFPEKS